MRKVFNVSLCKEGILGGGMYVDSYKLTYRTGKVTVSDRLRNLEMPLNDILKISKGWLLCFPTVTIKMNNNEEFKFIVFARNTFLRTLDDLGYDLCE